MKDNSKPKEIVEAIKVLERVSADDELREIYEKRERARQNFENAMNDEEKKGIEEGRRQMIELMRLHGISEDKIQAMLNAIKDENF